MKAWQVVSVALIVAGAVKFILQATLGEAVTAGIVTFLFIAAISYRHMYRRYSYYRQSDAEEHRKVVAELGGQINTLRAETRERGSWVNDGLIEWDEPEFKQPIGEPPYNFLYLATFRATSSLQPVRFRVEVDPPARKAKPFWSDCLPAVEDRLRVELLEGGSQIELFHSARLDAGGEVVIAVQVSSVQVDVRGDFEVKNVKTYRDFNPPTVHQSPKSI